MSNDADIIEARNLVLRSVILTYDQRVRLAALLRSLLDDGSILESNIFQDGHDVRFMAMYYSGETYRPTPLASSVLARFGHGIAAASGDYEHLVSEMFVSAARRGLVDKLVSTIMPSVAKSVQRPAPPIRIVSARPSGGEREAIKKEIRLLTLARHKLQPADKERLITLLSDHYRKGPVTPDNYVQIALNFLRVYYPQDYDRERNVWLEKHAETRAAPPATSSPIGQSPSSPGPLPSQPPGAGHLHQARTPYPPPAQTSSRPGGPPPEAPSALQVAPHGEASGTAGTAPK